MNPGTSTYEEERLAYYAAKIDRLYAHWLKMQAMRIPAESESPERIARCQARKAEQLRRVGVAGLLREERT